MMPKFRIYAERHEVWIADTVVEAETAEDARKQADEIFSEQGWDGLFSDDGEYEECYSEVARVEPVAEGDD
jgi:hypothetical protein